MLPVIQVVSTSLLATVFAAGTGRSSLPSVPRLPQAVTPHVSAPVLPAAPSLHGLGAVPALSPAQAPSADLKPEAPGALLQSLSREIPDFPRMGDGSKEASGQDFMRRLAPIEEGGPEAPAPEPAPAPQPAPPAPASPAPAAESGPVKLVIVLGKVQKSITQDLHLDWALGKSVRAYAKTYEAIASQLADAGLPVQTLEENGATPLAVYRRIQAVTVTVEGARAQALRTLLEAQGHRVYANSPRRIIDPVRPDPAQLEPSARKAVTIEENLAVTKAEPVLQVARERWGEPRRPEGWAARLGAWVLRALGAAPPQPPIGVIDTGIERAHVQLKGINEPKNVTEGENVDDNGHGTWVTGTIRAFAQWLRNLTHYKAFVNGGATLDDVLKALTLAGNDGNIVISNSWGSDDGDPKSPDSELVRRLAEEGHVLVFAAGNAGPGVNTIGSPAIVHYKDAKTGAIRVVSVAAADRAMKIQYFSSRGPGSEKTKDDPNYPKRPDVSAVGANVEGAWLQGGADRTDSFWGWVKALFGTSMSTPGVAGAIALLCMLFGVTTRGEALDKVVSAVMATLVKTGQGRDLEGDGFLNVEAAYKSLESELEPAVPGRLARLVLRASRAFRRPA